MSCRKWLFALALEECVAVNSQGNQQCALRQLVPYRGVDRAVLVHDVARSVPSRVLIWYGSPKHSHNMLDQFPQVIICPRGPSCTVTKPTFYAMTQRRF